MIFSRGMDTLAIRLRKEGHTVTIHGWGSRQRVQKKTIKLVRAGKLKGKIAIGGHSLGGNSASYMTNNLVRSNIRVFATFYWDATEPMAHAGDGHGHNFMSSDFRAEEVPGAVNHHFDNLNHVQIDKARVTHDLVSRVLKGLPA